MGFSEAKRWTEGTVTLQGPAISFLACLWKRKAPNKDTNGETSFFLNEDGVALLSASYLLSTYFLAAVVGGAEAGALAKNSVETGPLSLSQTFQPWHSRGIGHCLGFFPCVLEGSSVNYRGSDGEDAGSRKKYRARGRGRFGCKGNQICHGHGVEVLAAFYGGAALFSDPRSRK